MTPFLSEHLLRTIFSMTTFFYRTGLAVLVNQPNTWGKKTTPQKKRNPTQGKGYGFLYITPPIVTLIEKKQHPVGEEPAVDLMDPLRLRAG